MHAGAGDFEVSPPDDAGYCTVTFCREDQELSGITIHIHAERLCQLRDKINDALGWAVDRAVCFECKKVVDITDSNGRCGDCNIRHMERD